MQFIYPLSATTLKLLFHFSRFLVNYTHSAGFEPATCNLEGCHSVQTELRMLAQPMDNKLNANIKNIGLDFLHLGGKIITLSVLSVPYKRSI